MIPIYRPATEHATIRVTLFDPYLGQVVRVIYYPHHPVGEGYGLPMNEVLGWTEAMGAEPLSFYERRQGSKRAFQLMFDSVRRWPDFRGEVWLQETHLTMPPNQDEWGTYRKVCKVATVELLR